MQVSSFFRSPFRLYISYKNLKQKNPLSCCVYQMEWGHEVFVFYRFTILRLILIVFLVFLKMFDLVL